MHPFRDNAFKLKPLEMSDQLISHLKALETKLHGEARKLQGLVNQGKNKWKHYGPIIEEVSLFAFLAGSDFEGTRGF